MVHEKLAVVALEAITLAWPMAAVMTSELTNSYFYSCFSAILMNPLSPEIRLASRDLGSRMFIPSGGGGGGGGGSGVGGGGGGGGHNNNTAAGRLSSIINAVQNTHSNTNTLPIIR